MSENSNERKEKFDAFSFIAFMFYMFLLLYAYSLWSNFILTTQSDFFIIMLLSFLGFGGFFLLAFLLHFVYSLPTSSRLKRIVFYYLLIVIAIVLFVLWPHPTLMLFEVVVK
ncbi:MAG: hypothetical protein ACP5M7_08965 [Thermoproteota archaeon]